MKSESEKAIIMGIVFALATFVFIGCNCASAATIYHAAADNNTTTQNINITQSTSLKDDLVLDFSETQFSFIDPMESLAIFKFKATNTGTKNLLIHFNQYCGSPGQVPIGTPQGDTPLTPGESMWFKILPEGVHCGYDPNVPQTVELTLHMEFNDNNHNWAAPENNSFSLNETIQIKVINRTTLEGNVTIQGITVDEENNPIPYVEIDLGGYGGKVPIVSNATGNFSYSIAESPVYFLIAHKEGYRTASVEINGSNVQDFYTVTLTREPSPISVNASLINNVTGNIGFSRCAATRDESKLLLVNGMENWKDESLKNQSKLYLLDTNTGEVLWTHDMGWESYIGAGDITDDGKYVVFGTKLGEWQIGPPRFTNYIRLLNGTDGSTIWQKNITTENFPNTTIGFCTAGVFSHNENYILVHVGYEYIYLLNRSDGSVKWYKWVSQNVGEIIFTQDDQYVYIPSGSGWLYKLKVEDGSQVWKQWIGCWAYANGFDISPNEEYIAVGTKGAYLTVLNTSDGSVKFTKDIHAGIATCRFSPDGTRLISGGEPLTMQDLDGNILWRYYDLAVDLRFSGDDSLIFTANGGVFDTYGTMLYDILPGWGRSTKVGWINSNATRYIFAIQDTRTTEKINIIEVYSIETSSNAPPVASFSYSPDDPMANETITFNAYSSYDHDGTVINYEWDFGDGNITNTTEPIITHSYSSASDYMVSLTVTDDGGLTNTTSKTVIVHPVATAVFDTGPGTYPSIAGTHNGTITPNQTITVQKMYTYPCEGTGGHSKYARIWNASWEGVEAYWSGYKDDWHNITFDEPFTLFAEKTYYYEIRTGSYPQIHHTDEREAEGGMGIINCTSFVDVNGKVYNNWIPAIRLWS